MSKLPIVTVICLSFNHEKYVIEALNSVFEQTYPAIELIIVDDASEDESAKIIAQFLESCEIESCERKMLVSFFPLADNLGNCRAFNIGLAQAKGKYVIDLAADDVLMPDGVEKQVNAFEKLDDKFGVVFSDLYYVNANSEIIKRGAAQQIAAQRGAAQQIVAQTHFKRDKNGVLEQTVPQGYIYKQILAKSFISAPSMMIRKKILDELGGYDEELSYEDYDFWVRSARNYHYFFLDEIIVKKRILKNSHGGSFYLKNNKHLISTLKIHQKAYIQNQSVEENLALAVSVRYHLRLSFFTEHFELVKEFTHLLEKLDKINWKDRLIITLSKMKIPIFVVYQVYHFLYVVWQKRKY